MGVVHRNRLTPIRTFELLPRAGNTQYAPALYSAWAACGLGLTLHSQEDTLHSEKIMRSARSTNDTYVRSNALTGTLLFFSMSHVGARTTIRRPSLSCAQLSRFHSNSNLVSCSIRSRYCLKLTFSLLLMLSCSSSLNCSSRT